MERDQTTGVRETRIPVGKGSLYARDVGRGQPLVVLHGGPDFDQAYLLPDLDRLSHSFRLIYYDQRGRGQSALDVAPEDVTLSSEIADLEAVGRHFQLPSMALLGHSWGAILALEYALRHPAGVSHLILMNPAPASTHDLNAFRASHVQALGADMDRQRQIATSDAYKAGDPETVAARYRVHFKHALNRPEDYEKLMTSMAAAFIKQGKEGILKARAVEDRLMSETWLVEGYDLLSRLRSITVPSLVIAGTHDFIPVEISTHIAQAMPNARQVILENCGHFVYLECPGELREVLTRFF